MSNYGLKSSILAGDQILWLSELINKLMLKEILSVG